MGGEGTVIELPPELLEAIERPDVAVTINGVPADSWIVLLPVPGGAQMLGSEDIEPAHLPHMLRCIADVIEGTD